MLPFVRRTLVHLLDLFLLVNPFKNLNYITDFYERCRLVWSGDPSALRRHYLIGLLLLYNLFRHTLLYSTPFSPLTRGLLFDYFFLAGLPDAFNLTFIAVLGMVLYYHWVAYTQVTPNRTAQQAYRVLIQGRMDTFLGSRAEKELILLALRKLALFLLNLQQSFRIVLGLFTLFCQYTMACWLIRERLLMKDSSLTAYLMIGCMQFNALTTYVFLYMFTYLVPIAATISVIVTEIVFIRFKQAHRFLIALLSDQGPLSLLELPRFFAYHTRNLVSVLIFSQLYSKLLFAYIACNCPLSALILTRELRMPPSERNVQSLFFGSLLIGQFISFFGNHAMAALFPLSIHQSTRALIRFSLKHPKGLKRDLHLQIKLANAIAKLCTENRYGISFFSGTLLITMHTFVKFLVLYSQLFMYSYILFSSL